METSPQQGAPAVPDALVSPQVVVGGTEATTVAAPGSSNAPPQARCDGIKKVIVAVHGIGDQLSFATLQSVVNQFCAYYDEPAAVPLGRFYPPILPETAGAPQPAPANSTRPPSPYRMEAPPYPKQSPLLELAFAEVYWAAIPRLVVSEQHTLEEAKQWARTIVERFRMNWNNADADAYHSSTIDFERVKDILEELIQTLAVLERLCYLAERAGLFSFDLRKLLDDYLGDVQVVAEFRNQQRAILDTFHKTLQGVKEKCDDAQIYLVAHSEGTVVALLGLLEALNGLPNKEFAWVENVRGLMTFGSPIDKHLILWPELFQACKAMEWPEDKKIEWRNYYDNGDPIGFSLDYARAWLDTNKINVFNINPKKDDIGFTRYAFPGKAHVDYWQDNAVFGHFIVNVVNKGVIETNAKLKAKQEQYEEPPGTKTLSLLISYGLPFIVVGIVLLLAVYILFKALPDKRPENGLSILQDIASLALLLLGVTVAVRIPRLTQSWQWRVGAAVIFISLAAFCLFALPSHSIGEARSYEWLKGHYNVPFSVTAIRPLVAIVVMVLSTLISIFWPSWGMKSLLVLGTAALLGFVWWEVGSSSAALWPILLAAAAFFYLWWLAALMFDLVFVWYVHIRHEQVLKRMREMVPLKKPDASKQKVAAASAVRKT